MSSRSESPAKRFSVFDFDPNDVVEVESAKSCAKFRNSSRASNKTNKLKFSPISKYTILQYCDFLSLSLSNFLLPKSCLSLFYSNLKPWLLWRTKASTIFYLLLFHYLAMGAVVGKVESPKSDSLYETKLEAKMVEAIQRRAAKGSDMKSFNSLILKFRKIDESLRNCEDIFQQFDEDSNGAIDQDEMKHAFSKLEVSITDEEIDDLFAACDINEDMGIKFNEFIVLICIVFLLKDGENAGQIKVDMGMPKLEATFETLVDAFVFLDKNKDGYVSKSEMVEAINETSTGERSSGRIGMKRFEEMDWDRNGMVNFKEFLFAFIRWIGIDDVDDEDED